MITLSSTAHHLSCSFLQAAEFFLIDFANVWFALKRSVGLTALPLLFQGKQWKQEKFVQYLNELTAAAVS